MSVAPTPSTPTGFRPRRWPLVVAALLASFFLGLVVYIQVATAQVEEAVPFFDGAVLNLLSVLLVFFAFCPLYLWFVWFSGFSFTTRRVGFVIPLILPIVGIALFRYEGVDGYMKPVYVPRWQKSHEAFLASKYAPGKVAEAATPQAEPTSPVLAPVVDLLTETANDFPQFLGPQRNNYLPDVKLQDDWKVNPPKEVWRRDIGPGWSGFATRNGFAVTLEQRGSDEWVTCYSLATGEQLWHHSAPGRHEEAIGGLGPRSTPTIDGGLVFVQGATGTVRCIDGASGTLVWQDDLLERYGLSQVDSEASVKWGRAGSPLVVGDLVIVPPVARVPIFGR